MINGDKQGVEENLKRAFESGYANAASSLSQMTKDKITFNNFHFGFHKLDLDNFRKLSSFSRNGSNLLITTEIFGDVTGKSYLLVSETEFEALTATIPGQSLHVNLKEEFLKEMDNILSASVITKLANALNRKMYGDIPILIGKVTSKIENLIFDDFNENTEAIYVNSIFFSSESNPAVSPFFVWVIDSGTLKEPLLKPVQ